MRYSLLNFLCCPQTGEQLVALVFQEVAAPISPAYLNAAERVNPPATVVGSVPSVAKNTAFSQILRSAAAAPSERDLGRNYEFDIREALLVGAETGTWYPVIDGIPEILSANLRAWDRDNRYLDSVSGMVPKAVLDGLQRKTSAGSSAAANPHKLAEIQALEKVRNSDEFLAPGLVAPFYGNYHHAKDLIRGFANALPFLNLESGKVLLDAGCGYAWTTEWLTKIGVTAIGVDINRTYMDVGRRRMGPIQPHLVVADVENLPLKSGSLHGVLGFDAFHHVPDRGAAMRGFYEKLVPGGRVVFVEPGSDHKDTPQSIAAMAQFGTLEHGMDHADVERYVDGTGFLRPQELFLNVISNPGAKENYSRNELFDRSFTGWRIFVVERPAKGMSNQLAQAHRGLRAWAKRQPLIYWLYRKLRRWFL
jgi:SAM-dependent methyltransferase/uncharacterized protein YbaR (Trm112 family)